MTQTPAVHHPVFLADEESDDAIRELVEHYSASDERTMIVFFGDHQPPLGNDFYQMLYRQALDDRTTAEVMQQYERAVFHLGQLRHSGGNRHAHSPPTIWAR
jgi:phosphoglycerol transferase MdoB-like AlkP superfamily enzyme